MYTKINSSRSNSADEYSTCLDKKRGPKKCLCLEVRNIGVTTVNIIAMFLVSFTAGLYEKFNSIVLPFMLQE